MVAWSTLLRVLLILSLILNGTDYAVAHSQMEHRTMPASSAPLAAKPAAAAEPPCHLQHRQALATRVVSAPDAMTQGAAAKEKPPVPDCCKSGKCSCACAHYAQATVPALLLRDAVIDHARSARPVTSGHATPVFAQLIRPPIG